MQVSFKATRHGGPSDASSGSQRGRRSAVGGLANSRSLPHSIVQRAQIVLACGAGEINTAIAKRMGLTGMNVGKWYKLQGLT